MQGTDMAMHAFEIAIFELELVFNLTSSLYLLCPSLILYHWTYFRHDAWKGV
jgi:hypothetical protein